ncbi:MAG: hypothetical protein U9R58_01980 [Chloroflexota bacterium]|nr:hypothetical protein [Chloroflexota bacterium]
MNTKKSHPKRKFWQTFWIVVFLLSSIFSAYLVYVFRQEAKLDAPILIGLLTFVSVADIISLIALFFWKKWGWYLFAISTVASIVVGLVATANWLMPLNDVLPLVILGYAFKDQQDRFD